MRLLHRSQRKILRFGVEESTPPVGPVTPTIKSIQPFFTAGNAGNITVTKPPTLTSGDLWLLIMGFDGYQAAVPTGFVANSQSIATTPTLEVYSRRCDGSETDLTIAWGPLEQALIWSVLISGDGGIDGVSPITAHAATGVTNPSHTASSNNSIAFQVIVVDDNAGGTVLISAIPGSPWTEYSGGTVRTGLGGGLLSRLVHNEVSAGTVTGGSWTVSSARTSKAGMVIVKPA